MSTAPPGEKKGGGGGKTHVGDLVPVPGDVVTVPAHVDVRPLEDLGVGRGVHGLLEVAVFLPGLGGVGDQVVRTLLDGLHEGGDLGGFLGEEGLVGDVDFFSRRSVRVGFSCPDWKGEGGVQDVRLTDGAEAAASEFGEFVNSEHLDIASGAVLSLLYPRDETRKVSKPPHQQARV